MSTYNICFLWRNKKNYPRLIIKFSCLTTPLAIPYYSMQIFSSVLFSDPQLFSGHTGSIKNALFKDDSKQIISAADDKTVR